MRPSPLAPKQSKVNPHPAAMPSATACAPTSTSSPADDPDDFLLLLQDLLDRFHPVGADEETLVLRIAADQWRLDRAFPMEARIFRGLFYDVAEQDKARQRRYAGEKKDAEEDGDPVPPAPIPPEEGDLLARAFNIDCPGPNSFSKLARYESSIERSIDRCLRQLQKFQAARNNPPASGPQTDPEPPSAPPKTEDYETNPKNEGSPAPSGGLDAGPTSPTDRPLETSTPCAGAGAPGAPAKHN